MHIATTENFPLCTRMKSWLAAFMELETSVRAVQPLAASPN